MQETENAGRMAVRPAFRTQGRSTRHARISLAVALVTIALIRPCWSAELTPSEVARTLNIASFRNSVRPGLKPGTKTLAQNGFTVVEPVKGDASSVGVYLPDHSWLFEITVRRSEGDKAIVCILDKAENGGTYLSLKPLKLQRGRDGLLHATGRAVSDPRCELEKVPGVSSGDDGS